MSALLAVADCICDDAGCIGDPGPGETRDCQPCLDLHPADPCLRRLRDQELPGDAEELLEHWLSLPEAALSPDRMCRELAAVVAASRAFAKASR